MQPIPIADPVFDLTPDPFWVSAATTVTPGRQRRQIPWPPTGLPQGRTTSDLQPSRRPSLFFIERPKGCGRRLSKTPYAATHNAVTNPHVFGPKNPRFGTLIRSCQIKIAAARPGSTIDQRGRFNQLAQTCSSSDPIFPVYCGIVA